MMSRDLLLRPSEQEIRRIINAEVMSHFSEDDIASIEIDFDEDDDIGDLIVIKVIFDSKRIKINAKEYLNIAVALRKILGDMNEFGFPVLRLISKSDYYRRVR